MRISTITAVFKSGVKTVWDVVTDNYDYEWRSDLKNIKISEGKNQFLEYTKDGFSTRFITKKTPYKIYEFDMENKNMKGHWTGIFSELENGGTEIEFTEKIYIKNPILQLLSYVFMNLHKTQQTYVKDLRKKLGED